MSSSIVFLSDCTPLYTTLGAPERIVSVSSYPLDLSVRLEWQLPPNSNEVSIDAYIVRYGKYGAPGNLINGYITVFLPTVVIPNLENGVLYSFWVSAKNRFGESPLSPTVSSYAGAAPSPIQIVRRSYHASTQNVGIEFTPPVNNKGDIPATFTIKYRLMNGNNNYDPRDISFTQVESVQPYEQIKDASNNSALNTNGVKGNFIRKEVVIPGGGGGGGGGGFVPGRYRFTVMSTNIYGTSAASDTYFDIDLPAMTGTFSVRAPSFAYRRSPPASGLPNGDIYSITPFDGMFRFRWYKYIDIVNNAPPPTYIGWVYRIQYTDNKDYWYYPSPVGGAGVGAGVGACYPEYTVPYNAATDASGIHTLDISMCVINGRRLYVRYCVVDASGDASEYTQITDTNLDKTAVIPGKAPNPPPIFNAAVDDRLVRLYFNWTTRPPSLDLTGGYPILDYRIDRYKVNRNDGIYTEDFDATFTDIIGPFYEDTYDIRINGIEYLYRIYTRTSFGYSINYNSITAIPSRKSDIVHDVVASVGNNQITLEWLAPNNIDPGMPISQYYIEYRIYDIYSIYDISSVQVIPTSNIVGVLINSPNIGNNIQDMNAILVNDALWSKLKTTVSKIYTLSLNRSYTITDLINNTPYVFRVAAVTIDRVRRKLVGLMQVISRNSPYLSHPTIIGVVPSRLTNVVFTNLNQSVKIEWNSADITNSQNIIRFHVDYRIAGSDVRVPYLRQSFEYLNGLLYKDTAAAYFSVVVVGLENIVLTRPATNSDSYEIFVFAENSVGFTNTNDKVKLHDLRDTSTNLPILLNSSYENLSIRKYVRPMNIPNIIIEQR